jgi:RNA polymerase sigma factor (sigma-70 family)
MGPLQNMAFFVELPDDALLERAQRHLAGAPSRDEAAVSEVARRALLYARRTIRALDPDNPRWEDLAQDAGFVAWKKFEQYDPSYSTRDGQPTSWFKYVAGVTFKVLQQDHRRHRPRAIGELESKLTTSDGVAEIVAIAEDVDRLQVAVANLADEYRCVAEAYFLRGMTQIETAACLGLTQAQVNHRARKARELIAGSLSEKGTTAEHP